MGMNFKTAPIHIREKFSLSKNHIPMALDLLKRNKHILECVLLSTCNRVEVYALMQHDDIKTVKDFFHYQFNFKSDTQNLFYSKKDLDVIKHLCKVSSGLDSMIIGEPEIFGQVKESYRMASESGAVGNCFKVLFPQAFSVAKKVRSKTGISDNNVSVSYAAVKLAKNNLSEIAGRNVLLLGAGEIGIKTLRNLMDSGVSDVYIANRTFKKAVQLADKVQGIPIMLYEIKEYIQKIDILISSITVPHYPRLCSAEHNRGLLSAALHQNIQRHVCAPQRMSAPSGQIPAHGRLYVSSEICRKTDAFYGFVSHQDHTLCQDTQNLPPLLHPVCCFVPSQPSVQRENVGECNGVQWILSTDNTDTQADESR